MNVRELYLLRRREFIDLTQRDWEILSFLEQQGFATFSQLKERYFTCKPTCTRRLSKLQSFGYIESNLAIDLFLSPKDRGDGRLFPYISEFEIKPHMKIYTLAKGFRNRYSFSDSLIKRNMILHQLMLNDLRTKLEKEITFERILNDPKIKVAANIERGRHGAIRPDLSFECSTFKLAIELERTIKKKSRYYRRFLYYEDSIYTHVLYFTTDKNKLDIINRKARPYRKIAVAYVNDPTEVYHNTFGIISLQQYFRKVYER